MRLAEYQVLREELKENKKFIFERPLLIVLAPIVSVLSLTDYGLLYGFSFPTLILLLWLNMEFTANRLRGNARVEAYLRMLDSGRIPWEGWERAIGKYRLASESAVADSSTSGRAQAADRGKPANYYRIIYAFNFAPSLVFLLLNLLLLLDGFTCDGEANTWGWIRSGIALALSLGFVGGFLSRRNKIGPRYLGTLDRHSEDRWERTYPAGSGSTPAPGCE